MLRLLLLAAVLLAFTAAPSGAAKQCRDAKTGQFVSTRYAHKYPGLTVCEDKAKPAAKPEAKPPADKTRG